MVRQKKLLDQEMKSDPGIKGADDLPLEVWEKLESINDTEILYQEVDRYINDKRFS